MQMKRRIMAWSAAAAAGLAALFVVPSPALAAFSDCPAEVFCLWTDKNGEGAGIWANTGLPDLRVQNMNDKVSSVANNSTTKGLCLYVDLDFEGQVIEFVWPGAHVNLDLEIIDDLVTSVQWASRPDPTGC